MRTTTAGEDTVLAARQSAHFVKIEIKNAAGAWIAYGLRSGVDWQDRCEISQDVVNRVAQAIVELAREADGNTLAPLINSDIDAGRAMRISGARVAIGATPVADDYKPLFLGEVDSWDAGADPMRLSGRDDMGHLVDRWVEEETEYGSEAGTPLETVVQEILDDWTDGRFTLYTPVATGAVVKPYRQSIEPVYDALQALADRAAMVIEYRWDNVAGAFRLTLYEPDRSPASTDWTFDADDYYDVTRLEVDRTDIRNVVEIGFTDAETQARSKYTTTDDDSVARYGRRWMRIEEASDSPIDSEAEAQTMGDAALADLAAPIAEQEISVDLFWPVQLGDFDQFLANDVHYDVDQEFAVTGIRHVFERGGGTTLLQTRGAGAVGHTRGWHERGTPERPPEELQADVRLRDWRFIYDNDAGTVTIRWVRGALVHEVWLYDLLREEPDIPDNPWPNEGTLPTEILEVGTDEWVTDIPEAGTRRFIQFETRDSSGAPRWVRRFEIDPPPIADVNADVGDEEIAVGKLKRAIHDYRMSNPAPFSPLDYNTVQWAGFTLYTANAEYVISSGDTGNMTAGTYYYIYFDPDVSTTALQVTTVLANSQGDDKVFLCIAKPKSDTAQEAFFLPAVGILGGLGDDIISANIVAANIIAANTVTAVLMNVGTLSAITADLGTVTAGTIAAGVIVASGNLTAASVVLAGTFEARLGHGVGMVFMEDVSLGGGLFGMNFRLRTSAGAAGVIRATAGTLNISGSSNTTIADAGSNLSFFEYAQIPQQTVTGSRASGAALASLLTVLNDYGLALDGTSA